MQVGSSSYKTLTPTVVEAELLLAKAGGVGLGYRHRHTADAGREPIEEPREPNLIQALRGSGGEPLQNVQIGLAHTHGHHHQLALLRQTVDLLGHHLPTVGGLAIAHNHQMGRVAGHTRTSVLGLARLQAVQCQHDRSAQWRDAIGHQWWHLTNVADQRQRQHLAHRPARADDPKLKRTSRYLILHNSNTVLRRFSRREGRAEIEPHLQAIERLATQLIRAADMHQVRGLEGQAAKRYFAALRQLLPIGIDFAGRVRRPPRDPINVCLSLGYTVLATNLHTLVRTEGLNAHLGHLHASVAGSMALVSDLMEEFRAPVVDAVVLTLWRQGLLTDDDFEWADATDRDTLPCHLRSAGRRVLVDALEAKLQSTMVLPRTRRMLDVRRIMQSQVRHYLRVLQRQEAVYLPFKLR